MDIKELLEDAKKLDSDRFRQKLNSLVRENYRFQNLDEKNRKIILDLIKKYIGNIRNGLGINSVAFQNETYKLYSSRIKLGLTEEDLKDIKEILGLFKK
ncbi:hypothetical protein HY798_04755 [Candidatus Falkowbacteria bacterium]|nr:hypothetical protein [Candidatus Falkowbacteria bacterium]